MNTKTQPATLRSSAPLLAFATLLAVGLSSSALAQTATWGGSDGEYTTGANWVGGNAPDTNGGGTAHITAGNVTYTPGGDLPVHAGGTLRISGGSWTQADGGAWIQLSGGNLLIDGGTFNQGSAGNIIRDANSSITVSAGTANLNDNYIYQTTGGTLAISGTGTVNVANEFKPIDTFTMSGGTLSANLISFADGPGGINISGGLISLDGSGSNSGFYGGSLAKGLNFTESSSGTLFFRSYSATELGSDGFLTNGTIQLNGAANSAAFTVTEADGGVYVSLTTIPEPSTFVALAGLGALGFVAARRRRVGR